ncbi:MAG: GIY-YIG nuclease family protein [Bacteroidota bacterium]
MYTVYALYSEKYNKIYIGFTKHLPSRLQSHNSEKNTGYTKRYQPWKVVYTEEFDTKQAAMKREKELKSFKGREFIRNTILEHK